MIEFPGRPNGKWPGRDIIERTDLTVRDAVRGGLPVTVSFIAVVLTLRFFAITPVRSWFAAGGTPPILDDTASVPDVRSLAVIVEGLRQR